MPQNAIQFQKGLSETRFLELYGSEDKCIAAVERMRWPGGFVCPECGHDDAHRLERRSLLQCALCRTQHSITARTIFESTKLPLTTWFRAMYHLSSSKNGISALELRRRLGVTYRTAWLLKLKLSEVMREREAERVFTERVEIDDAYLGGERPARAGHAGRGADGKTPFLAAVETDHEGKPRQIALQIVPGFTTEAVAEFAKGVRPECGGVLGRAGLLRSGDRGRLQPHRLDQRRGQKGGGEGMLQVGEHGAGEHQERAGGHLPSRQCQACAAVPGRVRVPLQPSQRSGGDTRSVGVGVAAHGAQAVSCDQARRLTYVPNQVLPLA